ncbi:MAG: UDP-3-O-acyl-N-acetylglucosamine deacetylase [Acaryochloris sp. RU_4_1]|nr:UDP-3-O-acyl-N-acetylglucosamine deacetylase [Acaryochloris sp. RU_4_1]NJR55128.1 UDP-3-O-acyl-N-acetylglucosamine deacetylase [Acaryochloris sp. CRU_2_0]
MAGVESLSRESSGAELAIASAYQHTLQDSFTLAGIGLHTGTPTQVSVHPADPDQGRYFIRTDLDPPVRIAAHLSTVHDTQFSTTLMQAGVRVGMVEHLLAALVGLGIDNAQIEVQGAEVPLLDGSAQPWVDQILAIGWQSQSIPRRVASLHQAVVAQAEEAFVMALPHPQILFSYGIDFPQAAIGRQWCRFSLKDFGLAIAPARTFGRLEDVESLRTRGLIKGGSLENALVCDQDKWLNPPLRFANEPVRHKLLDLVGDLSLLGVLPSAHFVAYKASHALHIRFAQHLQASMTKSVCPPSY